MASDMKYTPLDKKKVARIKKILKKLNLTVLLPKLKNNTSFLRVYSEDAHTIEVGQAHGEIPRHTMQEIKKEFRTYMNRPAFNMGFVREPLTLSEYFMFYMPCGAALRQIPENSKMYYLMQQTTEMIKAMLPHAFLSMIVMVMRLCLCRSSLSGIGLLTFGLEWGNTRNGEFVRTRIMISLTKPTVKQVSYSGRSRSVYEVLFRPVNNFGFTRMSAKWGGEQKPCYIQSHAINRISERYNICKPWLAEEIVYGSAHEQEIIEYKGKRLIPVSIEEKRVGYLLCDIQEEFIVLKTFLLVTCDGTPEGDQFNEEVTLQKREKSMLHLDQLSTFRKKVLDSDPIIHSIVENSNLSYLIDLNLHNVYTPPYLNIEKTENGQGGKLNVLELPQAR